VSALSKLYEEIIVCQRCDLAQGRTKAVPGEGPEDADIMFIGEAPGFHEDRQGRPFVGAAGRFLEELLASINLSREEVYICNVIKCRPPGNRDPLVSEIETCQPFLDRQIELVKPRLIVTLGRFSMARYFPNATISRVHGQPKRVGEVIYYPMFHPAAALHQPRYRQDIEQDMLKIPQILAEAGQVEEERPEQNARQLSLF
jgi:uracil-DNA glycosylase family 4